MISTIIKINETAQVVHAEDGAKYKVVDSEGKLKEIVIKRKEDDLIIEKEGDEVVVLEGFYSESVTATLSVDDGTNSVSVEVNTSSAKDGEVISSPNYPW